MSKKRIAAWVLLIGLLLSGCTPENGTERETEEASSIEGSAETEPIEKELSVPFTLAPVEEALYDFTVFVKLDGSVEGFDELTELLHENANNLSVKNKNGDELAYEISEFSKSEKTLSLFVRLPEYSAQSNEIVLSATDKAAVPSSAWNDSYALVLHMDSENVADSSVYGNKLGSFGSLSVEDGALGSSLRFNGKNTYLTADPLALVSESGTFKDNAYSDTGYVKPYDWDHAQGLTCDGEYFYYAGHHDSQDLGCSIHKIRMSDMKEVEAFEYAGPLHGAEMDWNNEADTLFACTGGNGREAAVFEMSKSDGAKLAEWNFKDVGYGGAALVTYLGGRDILLFTSIDDGGSIAFAHITLGEEGKYEIIAEWEYSDSDLGVPQGLDTIGIKTDGTVIAYYLADAGSTVKQNPHYIYKLVLEPGKPLEISERYHINIGEETEGLALMKDGDAVKVYFGTAAEKIYTLSETLSNLTPTPLKHDNSPNSFTISFFVKVTATENPYPNVLGFGSLTNSQNRFALHLFGDRPGVIRFGTTLDGVWTKLDSPDAVLTPGGDFVHVAAAYDGERMKLYIDGIPVCSNNVQGVLTDLGGPFIIGADMEAGEMKYFFNGCIDEVRLSSCERSAAWILAESKSK